VGSPTLAIGSDVITTIQLAGTPGETVVVTFTGLLSGSRPVAQATVGDDGTVSVAFTVTLTQYIFGTAQVSYLVDGAASSTSTPIW